MAKYIRLCSSMIDKHVCGITGSDVQVGLAKHVQQCAGGCG